MSDIKVVEPAKKLVNNIGSFHESMLRNGYFLPSLKSSIISQDYMERVRAGDVWCPRYEDVLDRACPRADTKDALLNILTDILAEKDFDFGSSENHVPDKRWLLRAIAAAIHYNLEV